jgi:hypothetical protein
MTTGALGGRFCTDSEPVAIIGVGPAAPRLGWGSGLLRIGYHARMIGARARKIRLWLLWPLLLLAASAQAAEVSGVQVARDGEGFLIDMHIAIRAPAPAVFRALQDYPAMARYNPDLRAVRVESTPAPDRVRLFMTFHTCVLVFCKTMHQEEIMTATAGADGGTLRAELLPYGGDFKRGRGLWTVKPCPAGRGLTCLDISIELVPAFWVPPLIGPWVISRKMDEEAHRTGDGLEQTARALKEPRAVM